MSNHEYVLDSLSEDTQDPDYNSSWDYHRERVGEMLKNGLWGFLPGVLLGVYIISQHSTGNYSSFADHLGVLLIPLMIGFVLMGIPYGWEIINRVTGNWYASGSIFFVVFFYCCKFAFAYLIGTLAFPTALIYHAIMSLKSKKKIFVAVLTLIMLVFSAFYLIGISLAKEAAAKSSDDSPSTTEVTEVTEASPIVSSASFSSENTVLTDLCNKALETNLKSERESLNYGWTIPESTRVHAVFYLESKDPDNPHRNIMKKLDLSNAVVVVTGYFLSDTNGFSVNQWEMQAYVFPNFYFDTTDTLKYDAENEHYDSVRSADMDDFMDWFSSAYSDMTITDLPIPSPLVQ